MSDRTDGIAKELLALQDSEGKISAPSAVEWARKNKKSQLHAQLEWDDSIAGEKYRIWQVRSLITVHIVDHEGARRFVSLSIDRAEGGYRPLNDVLSKSDLRECMLKDALDELQRVERKYKHLQELDVVWRARDKVDRRRKVTTVADHAAA